ncbi:MAG: hypothetical protein CMO55_00325 [Verrucomicrobiales bacterium]|nr:hypothetical protein [Verrucomicrobiales bacterium]
MRHESEVLAPETAELLHSLGSFFSNLGFYLAGGTALAIHLGHRKSIDLDFFGGREFDPLSLEHDIREFLKDGSQVQVSGTAKNTLNLFIDGIKVDALRYSYPILSPPTQEDSYLLASIPDISAMKLSAVTNRGSKKDFFDIFQLLQDYSLGELLDFYVEKFSTHDRFMVLRSLTYFDDAEAEPEPILLNRTTWSKVKKTISSVVAELC